MAKNPREAILQAAKSQVGYKATSTTGKFCDWYGMAGYWCAMFVSWCAAQAGVLGTLVPRHAYTPSGANWFAAKGRWRAGTSGVRPGDIVYFSFGGRRIDHVGIFVGWSNGHVVTIDGNTGSAYGRSGGCVAYAKRPKSWVVGYGALTVNRPVVSEDGYWGSSTTKALQKINSVPVDGVVSSQSQEWAGANPGLTTGWDWTDTPEGSQLVAKLQQAWGVEADGLIGPNTIRAMQRYYDTPVDGVISAPSLAVAAMQHAINKQLGG